MKNLLHKIGAAVILSSAFFFSSCDPEFEDDIVVSKGTLNLSKYVAVGNSLTAGFQDNGLYLEGQLLSYPNILANQFAYVGGGAFAQPLFTNDQANGSGYLRLTGFSATGSPTLAPVTTNLATETGSTFFKDEFTGAVQNLGIPGIRLADVNTPGYGSSQGNPYFERITPDATPFQTYSARVAATAADATFFTMWLGNNDVLGFASSGGVAPITSDAVFSTNLTAMLSALPAQGLVMNIPDVTSVPLFTTIPVAALMQQAQAANTNLYITTGENTVRIATAQDYILLTSTVGTPESVGGTQIPHGFSRFNPLRNAEVLDQEEVQRAKSATDRFNTIIEAAANTKNVAFFDVNEYFTTIKGGMSMNGVRYSPAFITGNLFSLDGVHLTPRGYAILANEMIKTINTKYSATIPTIDVTQFRTVLIP